MLNYISKKATLRFGSQPKLVSAQEVILESLGLDSCPKDQIIVHVGATFD